MGLSADGELIWGIPILACDEEGEPGPFWDEGQDEWRTFEGLEIRPYGHYLDSEMRAVLTTESIPKFQGDCWTPKSVGDRDLDVQAYHLDAVEEFTRRVVLIDEILLNDVGWWLVAGYG